MPLKNEQTPGWISDKSLANSRKTKEIRDGHSEISFKIIPDGRTYQPEFPAKRGNK